MSENDAGFKRLDVDQNALVSTHNLVKPKAVMTERLMSKIRNAYLDKYGAESTAAGGGADVAGAGSKSKEVVLPGKKR